MKIILLIVICVIALFFIADKINRKFCKHIYSEVRRDNKYIYHYCNKCGDEVKNEWYLPNEPETNKEATSSRAAPNYNEGSI